jgi:hypothetical protein
LIDGYQYYNAYNKPIIVKNLTNGFAPLRVAVELLRNVAHFYAFKQNAA